MAIVLCPRCRNPVIKPRDIRTGWCERCKDWTMPDQFSGTWELRDTG